MALCLRRCAEQAAVSAPEPFSRSAGAGAVGFCDFAATAQAGPENRPRSRVGGCRVSDSGAVSRASSGHLAAARLALGLYSSQTTAENAILPDGNAAARRQSESGLGNDRSKCALF